MRFIQTLLALLFSIALAACGGGGGSGSGGGSVGGAAATTSVSGAVSGPWVEGVTITMSGGANGTTTTDASGNYSFAGLPSGQSYSFTASLPGYNFSIVGAVTIPGGSSTPITGLDFTQTAAVASSKVSGTLTYAGSQTGRIYVRLTSAGCTSNCGSLALTSIDNQGGAFASVPFEIRGVKSGSYILRSFIDTLDNGNGNGSNPAAAGTAFSVSAGTDVTGQALTIADVTPPTSFTMPAPTVFPGDQSALIKVTPPVDTLGREKATAYKIYWGTDAAAATGGGSQTYPALGRGNDLFSVSGLANGATYFKIAALVGATEYPASAVTGPVTMGAGVGGNTLSGTVSFPGTATGPMLVLAYSSTGGVYFTRIANPVSPQSYSITGIPDGTYSHIAVVDNDNNGRASAGDPNNANGSIAPVVVMAGAGATSNLTLTSASASGVVQTLHGSAAGYDWFGFNVGTTNGQKRVVKSVLYSGNAIAVPFDIESRDGTTTWISLGAAATVGDTYKFKVTYSDGTTGDLSAGVSGVLGANQMASNLSYSVGTISWTAPTAPPSSYGYVVQMLNASGTLLWNYPASGTLASTTTSVAYSGPALTAGGTYDMLVIVRDLATGNMASRRTSFTAP